MSGKKLIAIIDDDPAIASTITVILEASGYETVTALSGADGIELLGRVRPDLVLCDMMMENIDAGTGVITRCHALYPDVPVYLLSSIADTVSEKIHVKDLGLKGFLRKPVDPGDMVRVIGEALGKV